MRKLILIDPTYCLLAPKVYVLASQGRICGAGGNA